MKELTDKEYFALSQEEQISRIKELAEKVAAKEGRSVVEVIKEAMVEVRLDNNCKWRN